MIPDPDLIAEINYRWAGLVAPREKKAMSRKEVQAAVEKYIADGGLITKLSAPGDGSGRRLVVLKPAKIPVVVDE